MVDVIIPTCKPLSEVEKLLDQIEETAGIPSIRYSIFATCQNGKSAAYNRNFGLDAASESIVAMVDDDIEFSPHCRNWLRWIIDVVVQRPEVVMVSAQLYKPSGQYAYMTGLNDCNLPAKESGETIVTSKRLLTACCAFKTKYNLRFDEGYLGSGFEDVDFCEQLAQTDPTGIFLVCHDAHAVHRNEQKNQRQHWQYNKARFESKWGHTHKGTAL